MHEHPPPDGHYNPGDASIAPPVGHQAQSAWGGAPNQHGWYPQQRARSKAWIWALVGALAAVALSIGGFFLFNTAADPLRTLQEFPMESYLRNHESVLGTHFRAELVLDADLGGEIGKGRLFAFRSLTTDRLLPVLVPSILEQASFEKGQKYILELQVQSGGVVVASQCRKS